MSHYAEAEAGEQEAYDKGFRAGSSMDHTARSPYGSGSRCDKEWQRGFLDGYHDSEQHPPEYD